MRPNHAVHITQNADERELPLYSLQSLIQRTPGCRNFPRATQRVAKTLFPKAAQLLIDKNIRLVRE